MNLFIRGRSSKCIHSCKETSVPPPLQIIKTALHKEQTSESKGLTRYHTVHETMYLILLCNFPEVDSNKIHSSFKACSSIKKKSFLLRKARIQTNDVVRFALCVAHTTCASFNSVILCERNKTAFPLIRRSPTELSLTTK